MFLMQKTGNNASVVAKRKTLTGLHSYVRVRPCCNSMVFIKVYIVEIYIDSVGLLFRQCLRCFFMKASTLSNISSVQNSQLPWSARRRA